MLRNEEITRLSRSVIRPTHVTHPPSISRTRDSNNNIYYDRRHSRQISEMSLERVRRNPMDMANNPSNVFFLALSNFKIAFGKLFEVNRTPRAANNPNRETKVFASTQSGSTSGISVSHGIISAENSFLESDNASQISSDISGRSVFSNLSIDERHMQGNLNYYRNHRLNSSSSANRNKNRANVPSQSIKVLPERPLKCKEEGNHSNETLRRNSTLKNPSFPSIDREILNYVRGKNPRLAVEISERKTRSFHRKGTMRGSVVHQEFKDDLIREKRKVPRLENIRGKNSKSIDSDGLTQKKNDYQLLVNSTCDISRLLLESCDMKKMTQTLEVVELADNQTQLFPATSNRFEFNIPFCDIRFNEKLKSGYKKNIYRGFWHGEVIIHEYYDLNKDQVNRFWTEVEAMTYISHENIALFMGASMEPPNFAVVTSIVQGPSLYEMLHLLQDNFSSDEKVNIIRAVIQAISYLHSDAKRKIIKRLNSRNIFLHPRVTLCLLDFSETYYELELSECIHIPNEHMYYVAPEIFDQTLSSYINDSYPYISDNNYILSPSSTVSNFSCISMNHPSKSVTSPLFLHDHTSAQESTLKRVDTSLKLDNFEDSDISSPPESNSGYNSRRSSISSNDQVRPSNGSLDPKMINYQNFYASKCPKIIEEKYFTRQTDIYALGTIIYELYTNQYPFESIPIPEMVLKVCSKQRQSLFDLKSNAQIKRIIELCWSHTATDRPSAESIGREIYNIQSTVRKRACSQPDDLNQFHLSMEYEL